MPAQVPSTLMSGAARLLFLTLVASATLIALATSPDPSRSYLRALRDLEALSAPFASSAAIIDSINLLLRANPPVPVQYIQDQTMRELAARGAITVDRRRAYQRAISGMRYANPKLIAINDVQDPGTAAISRLREVLLSDAVAIHIGVPSGLDVLASLDSAYAIEPESLQLLVAYKRSRANDRQLECTVLGRRGQVLLMRKCSLDFQIVEFDGEVWEVVAPGLRAKLSSGELFSKHWDECASLDSKQAESFLRRRANEVAGSASVMSVELPGSLARIIHEG
jgi:hypothetical protein